jgi:beta-barrel assembly-enhancing protease
MKSTLIIFALLLLWAAPRAKDNEEGVHRESLIAETRDYERQCETSHAFLDDTAVTAYVTKVLRSLASANPNIAQYRAKILKSPVLNAFATPHGAIYVTTGLLAMAENEAQLGAILSHEVVHILNDHAARNLLQAKKSALSSAHLRIGLDFFIGSLAGSISGVALRSAVTGYSRDLEREADSVGLSLMMKAGYPPVEFRNLFMLIKARIERGNIREPFFFSTHPAITERISNYGAFAGKDTAISALGKSAAEAFTRIIAPVLVYDGIAHYAAGAFDLAQDNFSRVLDIDSCCAAALVYRGACKRHEGSPQSDIEEVESYRKAVQCDPSFHEALRELGFRYFKSGDQDSAAYYFTMYKTAFPGSPYLPIIMDYLKQCVR